MTFWRRQELVMLESLDRRLSQLSEDLQELSKTVALMQNVKSAKLSRKAFWTTLAFAAFGPLFAVLWNTVIK